MPKSLKSTKQTQRIFRAYGPYPMANGGGYVASIWDVTNQEPVWSPYHSEEQRIAKFVDTDINVVQFLLDASILTLYVAGWGRSV